MDSISLLSEELFGVTNHPNNKHNSEIVGSTIDAYFVS